MKVIQYIVATSGFSMYSILKRIARLTTKFSIFILLVTSFQYVYAEQTTQAVLVSYQEIQALAGNNIVFIDVRTKKEYDVSHIVGAIYIDVENTFNRHGDPTRIAPLHQVQKFLSAAGVKNSDYIILYDNGDLKNAAHLYWLLETYNHKKVSVIDGGFTQWLKMNGEISKTPHTLPKSQYLASISPDNFATKLTTRLAIDNRNIVILDSRTSSEFNGLKSKANRHGHIQGAVSYPWSDNFISESASGLVKDKLTLSQLYQGISKDKQVITYCNRGKQSAVSYLIMRHLGYKVSVYDGGWLEWGNDSHLPITRIKSN